MLWLLAYKKHIYGKAIMALFRNLYFINPADFSELCSKIGAWKPDAQNEFHHVYSKRILDTRVILHTQAFAFFYQNLIVLWLVLISAKTHQDINPSTE